MKEGGPQAMPEKRKHSNLMEAAFLSMGILVAHPEAKALEIDPYTPWHIGVKDNLRVAVKKDKVEYATVYAYFTDRSGEWVTLTKGELGNVTNDVRGDFERVQKQARAREIVAVCHIHAHQAEILKDIPAKERPKYHPPSFQDIRYSVFVSRYYVARGMNQGKVRFAVADERGIWYYGGVDAQNTHDISHAIFVSADEIRTRQKDMPSFMWRSANPTFNLAAELPALERSYATHMSGKVRFVPFSKIETEPPCAGVNYK